MTIIERETFTTQRLSNGDEVTILRALGVDVFNANKEARGDQYNYGFYFLCQITKLNGSKVSIDYLKKLSVDDLLLLYEVINSQSAKINFK